MGHSWVDEVVSRHVKRTNFFRENFNAHLSPSTDYHWQGKGRGSGGVFQLLLLASISYYFPIISGLMMTPSNPETLSFVPSVTSLAYRGPLPTSRPACHSQLSRHSPLALGGAKELSQSSISSPELSPIISILMLAANCEQDLRLKKRFVDTCLAVASRGNWHFVFVV